MMPSAVPSPAVIVPDLENTRVVETTLPCPASPAGTEITALTRGLRAGNDDAYRALHAAYHDRLSRYLIVVCRGDDSAARDALQETWIRVARHARQFDAEPDLWRWLAALARSAAVDLSRRRSRYGAALSRYIAWFRPPTSATAEDQAAEDRFDQLATLLDQGLEALPEADRALLVDRYRHGRSVRELAVAAEITEKAMESRLGRLRASLRKSLLSRLDHELPPTV